MCPSSLSQPTAWRKGLTDTALKTAESGYLTRRLVDVAQDVVIIEEDCGTDRGYLVEDIVDRKTNTILEPLAERLIGRYSQDAIVDPNTGEILVEADTYMDEAMAQRVVNAGVTQAYIRNTFTCESTNGVCRKCYGRNMATASWRKPAKRSASWLRSPLVNQAHS